MRKLTFLLLFLIIIAGSVAVMPKGVSADHSYFHTLQQIQQQIFILQGRINALAALLLAVKPESVGKPADTPAQSAQPATGAQPATPAQPSPGTGTPAQPATGAESSQQSSTPAQGAQPVTGAESSPGAGTPAQPATGAESAQPKKELGLVVARNLEAGSSGEDVKKLQGFLKKFPDIYPEGMETGYFGPLTEAAVKRFQERYGIEVAGVVGPKTRALLSGVPGSAVVGLPSLSKTLVPRTLQRGASGNDVKEVQGFLKRFPNIYPEGLETGYYGPLSEKAIGRLQEILGLEQVGIVGPQTQKKMNELSAATLRKQPPKIFSVSPTEAAIDTTKITLSGRGFTLENNSIFIRGQTVMQGLVSVDGTTLEFTLPPDTPCAVKKACPIKVTNSNGISNARPIKLVEAEITPEPPPADEPPVLPPPPVPEPTPEPVPGCTDPEATNFNAQADEDNGSCTYPEPEPPPPVPTPLLTVVSPNGGETYKYGDQVAIIWEAERIASKLVDIKLLRAGALATTIASNVPQSEESGNFIYNWTIPISLAVAADYAIEISDTSNLASRDTSDREFRIASNASVQIYGPNGGETVVRGFSALLFWNYSGYTPESVNVNLYKTGVFYRQLVAGVKPSGFSGPSSLREPYPLNSRYAAIPIPLDIPDGDDYTLEIVDGADSFVLDRSDAPFRITTLPSPVTFKGRLLDRFTLAPVEGVSLGGYGTYSYSNGTMTTIKHPTATTDANGAFSFSTTTDHMISEVSAQALIGVWPRCYNSGMASLYRYPPYPVTVYTVERDYTGRINYSDHYKMFPLLTAVQDWGDALLWPVTSVVTYSDIPVTLALRYQNALGLWGGGGNSLYKVQHNLSGAIPLDIDTRVEMKDQSGTLYYSPFVHLSRDYGCAPKAISFMNGTFQWEPYAIGISASLTGGTVGLEYKGVVKTFASTGLYSAGLEPLIWEMAFGSLPPGLSLNSSTGEITGTPTTAGTYYLGVKVKDANGVRASRDLLITIK